MHGVRRTGSLSSSRRSSRAPTARPHAELVGVPVGSVVLIEYDVRAGRGGPVPVHLRGTGKIGGGRGYAYAHDHPDAVAEQQYLPDDLDGTVEYYRPTDRGVEARLAARLEWLRERLRRSGT